MDPATNATPAAQAAATPAPDRETILATPSSPPPVATGPSTAQLVQTAVLAVDGACRSIRAAIAGEAEGDGTPDGIAKLTELLRRLEAHRKDLSTFARPAAAAAALPRTVRPIGTRTPEAIAANLAEAAPIKINS